MKQSQAVSLALVPLVASWFAGCSDPKPPTHQKVCMEQSHVVDDAKCLAQQRGGGAGFDDTHRGGGGLFPYWFYMNYRAGGYPIGYVASQSEGSRVAPAFPGARVVDGHAPVPARTGGFGSSATSSGAGE